MDSFLQLFIVPLFTIFVGGTSNSVEDMVVRIAGFDFNFLCVDKLYSDMFRLTYTEPPPGS